MDPMTMSLLFGGGALANIGGSIAQSLIGSSAADKAAAAMLGATDAARKLVEQTTASLSALFRPYISAGTSALAVAQSRMYSSSERALALKEERLSIEAKIEQLSKPFTHEDARSSFGPMESERTIAIFQQMEGQRKRDLINAQAELVAFDKRNAELLTLYEKQDAEYERRASRIESSLDTIARLSNLPASLADIREQLVNDPVYQFKLSESERAINRAAAARGSYFSGAAVEQLGENALRLTGQETNEYIQRQALSLQAATTGLQAQLAEQQQYVSQPLSLATLGETATGQLAGATASLVGTSAQATVAGGQAVAQSELQKGAVQTAAVGSSLSGLGSLATLALLTQGKKDVTPTSPTTATPGGF